MVEIQDRRERSESRGVNIQKKTPLGVFKMAGTTRLVLDLLHAHRVSPKKALLLPAQSVRYPDLFTTFTPSVRKSAELANTLLATINSAIKKSHTRWLLLMAGTTRLELATSCVTGIFFLILYIMKILYMLKMLYFQCFLSYLCYI